VKTLARARDKAEILRRLGVVERLERFVAPARDFRWPSHPTMGRMSGSARLRWG
jgi:hypothetical protein